ncbi:MAG TPA: PDZ domain-containing protein [Niabella sp.]|nr:PDZ domain-containing protein [Niabella sp.]
MKSIYYLSLLLLPCNIFAQTTDKNKEAELIIITKKADDNRKLEITVDGAKITVNGKDLSTDKNSNITVRRRKIKDIEAYNALGYGSENFDIAGRQLTLASPPNKAMLGVSTKKTDQGAEVVNVNEESAAGKAGLKEGDIITSVDKNKIETPDDLSKALKDKNPGDKVSVVFLRNQKQNTVVAELTKWQSPDFPMITVQGFPIEPNRKITGLYSMPAPGISEGSPLSRKNVIVMGRPTTPRLGIKIQDLESGSGVKVLEVAAGSDADKAGLKQGDIIMEVNGAPINSTDTISAMVASNRSQTPLKLKIERNGKAQNLEVKFSKKIKTADL